MKKYLKFGSMLVVFLSVYGCDSGSDKPTQTPPAAEGTSTINDRVGLANEAVKEALDEAAKEARDVSEEKAAKVMTNFEEKFEASTEDLSEEDKAAAMELLGEFQEKLEAEAAAGTEP